MLHQFATALANTSVSKLIEDISWIVPLVQTIHILALAIILSSAAMLNLRLMGLAGRRVTIAGMSERFLPWVWAALAVLAVTGIILIVGEPERSLPNFSFQLKMALLAAVIVITIVFQRTIKRNADYWDLSPGRRRSARVTAVLSLAMWMAIAVCGRLIAYTIVN
jgi:uncharacterized membrane protein